MLTVTGLRKTFTLHLLGGRRLDALLDVSMTVAGGELVAILGASGSGKSTLLKCLSRTYRPTGGHAWYDSNQFGPVDLVVAEPLLRAGVDRTSARDQARAMMARLHLPAQLHDAYPATFSGGERQRVNLARAMVAGPRLLLLDEPTAALDPTTREAAKALIREQVGAGAAAIGVFHDLLTVADVATRGLLIDRGRVAAEGSPMAVIRLAEQTVATT